MVNTEAWYDVQLAMNGVAPKTVGSHSGTIKRGALTLTVY